MKTKRLIWAVITDLTSQSGRTIQFCDDLSHWTALDVSGNELVFSATALDITLTDPTPLPNTRFYRAQIREP